MVCLCFFLRPCTCIHWLPCGSASCKSLAQHEGVGLKLRERRGSVHSSSATHLEGAGLLGDLDLERGWLRRSDHNWWAAALPSELGGRVHLGVLLRERAPPRGGDQVMAAVKGGVGDLGLVAAPSSVASWSAMGFTGGPALVFSSLTKYGLARDFGSVPGKILPSVLDPACEADGFGRTIGLENHSGLCASRVSWGVLRIVLYRCQLAGSTGIMAPCSCLRESACCVTLCGRQCGTSKFSCAFEKTRIAYIIFWRRKTRLLRLVPLCARSPLCSNSQVA